MVLKYYRTGLTDLDSNISMKIKIPVMKSSEDVLLEHLLLLRFYLFNCLLITVYGLNF
jgi:hypothetical protein